MEFRTTFSLDESKKKMQHGEGVICLGSCFSKNIGNKLNYYGWKVLNNPFGTIFHPLAIAHLLSSSLEDDFNLRFCKKDELFYAFEAHSFISGKTLGDLEKTYKQQLLLLKQRLGESNWLFITFGSAWGYILDGQVVANCHKQMQQQFEKKLSEAIELIEYWRLLLSKLKTKFPQLKCVFTVSPVRHKKDGIIENQRSKARLIELVHALNESYFPAYELLLDDLRDYRFYANDMLHPSEFAIEYIFEKFTGMLISSQASELFPHIAQLRKMEAHRPSSDNASESPFAKNLQHQKDTFLEKHPLINW